MNNPVIASKSPTLLQVEPGTYYWCACGRSKAQPFCDGSHHGTGLAPVEVEVTESRNVAWCRCKHTKVPGFCDGSHKQL